MSKEPTNKNEVEALRLALEEQREHSDSKMAELLLLIQGLALQNRPPQEQPPPPPPRENPELEAMMAKIAKLEQSVQKQEKVAATGVDMNKLCLFPDAKFPEGFKPIAWEKFDGSGDPKAHLQTYVGTLSMYNIEKNAMGQMFQQTLAGPALRWFLGLDISKKGSWEDIGAAFMAQYNYNIQLEMTIRELDATKMGANESFADFIKRWRGKASQMIDRPSEKEQMRIITRNLSPDFAKHLVVFQATADFKTFYEAGLAVEEAIQSGIFKEKELVPNTKQVYPDNTHTLFSENDHTQASFSSTNQNFNQAMPISKVKAQTNHSQKPQRTLFQFSEPLSLIYERLLKSNHIKPLIPTPLPQKLPSYHNPNAFCAFHQMPGHATDECQRLHHRIQNLIDSKTIISPPTKTNT